MSSKRSSSEATTFTDEESHQLLTSEADDVVAGIDNKKRKTRFTCLHFYIFILHVGFVGLAVVAWLSPDMTSTMGSWSPLEKHLEYGIQDSYEMNSRFAGKPNADTKAAWDTLALPIYYNASEAELLKAGVPLTNRTRMTNGGYLTSVGVLHELHCLQMFRFFIYFDHYYRNITAVEKEHIIAHLDHCLDNIRSSLMCKPNTKLITFNWNEPSNPKPQHESHSQSQCVKWSSVQDWAKSVSITNNPDIIRVAPAVESE